MRRQKNPVRHRLDTLNTVTEFLHWVGWMFLEYSRYGYVRKMHSRVRAVS